MNDFKDEQLKNIDSLYNTIEGMMPLSEVEKIKTDHILQLKKLTQQI